MTTNLSPTAARRGCLTRLGGASAPRRRLYCVPFAGGGPAAYRLWATDLPDDVEVVAVQLPGRNPAAPGPRPDSVAELVAILQPELEAAADVPFALFGHSLGALVAFELTVALEQRRRPGPAAALRLRPRRRLTTVRTGSAVHALPDDEFLDAISVRFGGVPDAIRAEPELLALLLPALRADVRTFETYAPLTDRTVRCPVHVYGGADDAHPRPDAARRLAGRGRAATSRCASSPAATSTWTTARAALDGRHRQPLGRRAAPGGHDMSGADRAGREPIAIVGIGCRLPGGRRRTRRAVAAAGATSSTPSARSRPDRVRRRRVRTTSGRRRPAGS